MAGNQIGTHQGTQPHGAQGRNHGDEAVNHHRPVAGSSAQECAAHGCQVKTAHLLQHIHRVPGVRFVDLNCPGNDFLLLPEGGIRNAAAPAGNLLNGNAQKHSQHSGRSGGIADAHFSHTQGIRFRFHGKLSTNQDGFFRLFAGHGRALKDILCPHGDFPIQNLWIGDHRVDAHIANRNTGTKVLGKDGSTGFGTGQVDGLHQGYGLGRTGNPLLYHTIVRRKNQQVGMVHGIVHRAGNAG